jgi:hypothetical protein
MLVFTVLERADADGLADREGFWMAHMNTLGFTVCNKLRRIVRHPTRAQRLAAWLRGEGPPMT